jgi:hypothetical protein
MPTSLHSPFDIITFFYKECQVFLNFFVKYFCGMSHNVPAVYDVLAARIRALRSKDQGRQNVGGVIRGNEAKRNDLGERNPSRLLAAKRKQSRYVPFLDFNYFLYSCSTFS